MTAVRSKRRVLPLIFIVKSFTKSLLILLLLLLLLLLTDIPDDSEIYEYEYMKIIYVNCG